MLGGVDEGDFLWEDFAGDFGEDFNVGVDDGGPEVFRGRDLGDVELFVGADEDDATEEAGADVVGVPCAVGGGFAGHGEGEELAFGEGFSDEFVDGVGACDGGCGRGAEAGAEGHFFMDFHFDAAIQHAEVFEQV